MTAKRLVVAIRLRKRDCEVAWRTSGHEASTLLQPTISTSS
jgi:hypothetical protein